MDIRDLRKKISSIRSVLNIPMLRARYTFQDKDRNRLWASIEALQNACLGIEYYLKTKTKDKEVGRVYILIYGLLQLFYVQQDALVEFAKSIKCKLTKKEELNNIRDIRNDIAGHPTNRKRGSMFCTLPVPYISYDAFSYVKWEKSSYSIISDINLIALIEKQIEGMDQGINEIIKHIKDEWRKMREEMIKTPLAHIFEKSLISEIAGIYDGYPLNLNRLNFIKEKYEIAVKAIMIMYRNELDSSGTGNTIRELNYLFSYLNDSIRGITKNDPMLFSLLGELFQQKCERFYRHCEEIDLDVDKQIDETVSKLLNQ